MPTHTADYRYILKELSNGENSAVWALECYPETRQLPFISKTGGMYLRFKATTSESTAKQIRALLNENVENVSVHE